jgi:hypothetical protein
MHTIGRHTGVVKGYKLGNYGSGNMKHTLPKGLMNGTVRKRRKPATATFLSRVAEKNILEEVGCGDKTVF